jgi:serine/threonine-protein kinase
MTVPSSARGLRPFKPIPFGRYTLVAPIATGGMGEIFLARMEGPQGFEKFCVIKKILPHLAEDTEFVERFVNEAKTLVKLSHGSIAQVLDMGLHDGDPYIALEHVDGKDLRKVASRMREQGTPPPLTYVLYVMSRVLDALAYAHRKRDEEDREIGLVHRDISPQNILVSYEGEVKVIDFGLAKSTLSSAKTNPSIILGKFMYMSPEQARHQPADRRSDLYSVALCLYELIAGKNPFDDAPTGELMQRVANPQIPSLLGADPLLPPNVAAVVQKGLQPDPDHRYQTAEEFRGKLMACLLEIDSSAGPESVSRFMRETFAGEYAAERRMLQALKEAQRPSPDRQDTGIVNLAATMPPPPPFATPLAPMPAVTAVSKRTSPLVSNSPAQARWSDNRHQVTEVATEHDVPVLRPPPGFGITPQAPVPMSRAGTEPTQPRAPLPDVANEATRRATLPDPPERGARHPLLRSREEITDPSRNQFAHDDLPDLPPGAVLDLLAERERESTVRAPIPHTPEPSPRVGLAVTMDEPRGPPSLPGHPRVGLQTTMDDPRAMSGPPVLTASPVLTGLPVQSGPPRIVLGSTADAPAPVYQEKYKSGPYMRPRPAGVKPPPESPALDLGTTMDMPSGGPGMPLRTSEPTDRIARPGVLRRPPRAALIALGGLILGGAVAGGVWAVRSGVLAGPPEDPSQLSPIAPTPAPAAAGPTGSTGETGPADPAPAPPPVAVAAGPEAGPGETPAAPPDGPAADPRPGSDDPLAPLTGPAQTAKIRKVKRPRTSPLMREWAKTQNAFEDLVRVKPCDLQTMGVLCSRYRQLRDDIEASDDTREPEKLLQRVRSMYESIAAKRAQR